MKGPGYGLRGPKRDALQVKLGFFLFGLPFGLLAGWAFDSFGVGLLVGFIVYAMIVAVG